jgi:uncharacterized protein (DUF305 family)
MRRKWIEVATWALLALFLGACTVVVPPGEMADHADMPGMDHGAGMETNDAVMEMVDSEIFDAQFIDGMIEHHQGAIDMAGQVLAESERPELRTLAEEIIAAQSDEIEQMRAWRAAWFPDLEPTGGMDMDMGEMEISPDTATPFDQRFIEAMISHHVGAVHMAEMALQMSAREEIHALAEAIIADQQAEIELMQGWLQEWYGEGQ